MCVLEIPRNYKKWDLLPNILAEDRQYTKRIGSAFSKEKTVSPLLLKTYQPNLTSQELQRKRKKSAKVPKVKKKGNKSW
jgi:hypothetical protein